MVLLMLLGLGLIKTYYIFCIDVNFYKINLINFSFFFPFIAFILDISKRFNRLEFIGWTSHLECI